jgi:hypothetical protein
MNHYKADLGRWEKGISVEFEAEDQVAAMKIARDSLDTTNTSQTDPANQTPWS